MIAALVILGLVLGGGVLGWHAHALAQPWRPAPAPSANVQSADAVLKSLYPPEAIESLAWPRIVAAGESKQMRLARQLAEQSMLAALYRSCALSGEKPRAADVELAEVRRVLGHSVPDAPDNKSPEQPRRQEGPTS